MFNLFCRLKFGAGCYSCAVIANYERMRYNQMNLNQPQKSKYSEFRNNVIFLRFFLLKKILWNCHKRLLTLLK